MKENKALIWVCLLMIVLSGISIGCSDKDSVVRDISLGIFSGVVVAFISSIINYFLRRQAIINRMKTGAPVIYMNMLAICKIINNIIFHLAAVQKIDEANFTNIDSFFDKSIKLVDDIGHELYSEFYEKEQFFIAFGKILQCRQVLYDFRSDLIRLHIDAIRNGWVNCFPTPKIPCQFAMPFSREGFNLRMGNVRKDIESLMAILESICEKYLFGKDGKWRNMKPNLEKYADSMSQLY